MAKQAQATMAATDGERKALLEEAAKLSRHAVVCESRKAIDAAGHLLCSDPVLHVEPDQMDAPPWLLNTPSGVVNLMTGDLLPHERALYLTQITNVGYDPDATCPRWEQFVSEIFSGDMEIVEYVQKFFGYSLTGIVREAVFAIFWGHGRNGKTTLLEAIREVMGSYAVALSADVFVETKSKDQERAMVPLYGKRLATASESKRSARMDTSCVKAITGKDALAARKLYGETFDFIPQHHVVLATNHMPEVRDTDDGIWGRVAMVPFLRNFEREGLADPGLSEKLAEEKAGILRWLVDGCLKWQRHGLTMPSAVKAATEGYKTDQDRIGEFVTDHLEIGDPESQPGTSLGSIYQRYRSEMIDAGQQAVGKTNFNKELKARLAAHGLSDKEHYVKTNAGYVWRGVRLNTQFNTNF